jgi:hypothetical protein
VQEVLDAIKDRTASIYDIPTYGKTTRRGVWDVVAWKQDRLRFVEVKFSDPRTGYFDTLGRDQYAWLDAALGLGHPLDCFLLVEAVYA